jgi:hypothetical protein
MVNFPVFFLFGLSPLKGKSGCKIEGPQLLVNILDSRGTLLGQLILSLLLFFLRLGAIIGEHNIDAGLPIDALASLTVTHSKIIIILLGILS